MLSISTMGLVEKSTEMKEGEFDGKKTPAHHAVSLRVLGEKPFSVKVKLPIGHALIPACKLGTAVEVVGKASLMPADKGASYLVWDVGSSLSIKPVGAASAAR